MLTMTEVNEGCRMPTTGAIQTSSEEETRKRVGGSSLRQLAFHLGTQGQIYRAETV